MRAPTGVGMRLLRASALAGASVGLGGVAHTHAAVAELSARSAGAVALVLALSWVATARQVTWPVVALILGGGQGLTHVALSAGAGTGSHGHGGGAVSLPADSASAMAPVDARMLLLHAGAWVALTVLFTVGERALWRSVQRLLTPWSLPAPSHHRPRSVAIVPLLAVSALAHRSVRGRAPPLG
jgi:hypothetical protein